jgi:hypothetical protein
MTTRKGEQHAPGSTTMSVILRQIEEYRDEFEKKVEIVKADYAEVLFQIQHKYER